MWQGWAHAGAVQVYMGSFVVGLHFDMGLLLLGGRSPLGSSAVPGVKGLGSGVSCP